MSKNVIKFSNVPVGYPVTKTVVAALAMDYWNAPEWLWGVMGCWFLVLWILAIWSVLIQEQVDIFEVKEDKLPMGQPKKSTFMDKLEERMRQRKNEN